MLALYHYGYLLIRLLGNYCKYFALGGGNLYAALATPLIVDYINRRIKLFSSQFVNAVLSLIALRILKSDP